MSAKEELDIGQARADEADDILRLMCEAFLMEFDTAKPIYYSDPYFQIENKMVARLGGQVVSCLTIVERECWLGDATIKLAGIAGVATAIDHRRQGIASRLLQSTIAELARRRYPIAALYPEDRGFYRRFGFETAGAQTTVRCRLAQPQSAPTYAVSSASESDIREMSDIYLRASAGRAMHCLRDEIRWRYLLRYVPGALVARDAEGVIAGYALYETRAADPEHNSNNCAPGAGGLVRLLEMYCDNLDAAAALRCHIAGLGANVEIQYSATPAVLVKNGFTVASEPQPALMARIVDWSGLIQVLARSWPTPTQSVGLVMTDPLSTPTTRGALVTCCADGADVEFVDPAEFPSRCSRFLVGDVGAWSAVAVGHLSAREACRLGVLKASCASAIEAADPLFPARDPFIPTADHF